MIDPKELRIGNWVTDLYGSSQVQQIGNMVTAGFNNWYEDQIEPVPLTPEILEKAGFDACDDSLIDFKLDGKYYIYHHLDYWEFSIVDTSVDINLKHLHQLQNLYFALTETELNIEL